MSIQGGILTSNKGYIEANVVKKKKKKSSRAFHGVGRVGVTFSKAWRCGIEQWALGSAHCSGWLVSRVWTGSGKNEIRMESNCGKLSALLRRQNFSLNAGGVIEVF